VISVPGVRLVVLDNFLDELSATNYQLDMEHAVSVGDVAAYQCSMFNNIETSGEDCPPPAPGEREKQAQMTFDRLGGAWAHRTIPSAAESCRLFQNASLPSAYHFRRMNASLVPQYATMTSVADGFRSSQFVHAFSWLLTGTPAVQGFWGSDVKAQPLSARSFEFGDLVVLHNDYSANDYLRREPACPKRCSPTL
jgi:hypothetical protein